MIPDYKCTNACSNIMNPYIEKQESIRTTIKFTFQKTGNRRSLDNYVRPDLDTYQKPKMVKKISYGWHKLFFTTKIVSCRSSHTAVNKVL